MCRSIQGDDYFEVANTDNYNYFSVVASAENQDGDEEDVVANMERAVEETKKLRKAKEKEEKRLAKEAKKEAKAAAKLAKKKK